MNNFSKYQKAEYSVKRFKEKNEKEKNMEEMEKALESGLPLTIVEEIAKDYGFVSKSFAGGITYLEFFCSNKVDIELLGIKFFGGKAFGRTEVFLEILEQYYPDEGNTAKSVYQHTFNPIYQEPFTPFELKLTEPVYIHHDVIYAIRFELMGQETFALKKELLKDFAVVHLGRKRATEVKLDFFGARAIQSVHQIPEMRFRLPAVRKDRSRSSAFDLCNAICDFFGVWLY